MSYREDLERLRHGPLADGVLRFSAVQAHPAERSATSAV